jgi:hypothetical protein
MTCGVHGIYLKFESFNGIDPIVPKFYGAAKGIRLYFLPEDTSLCGQLGPRSEAQSTHD